MINVAANPEKLIPVPSPLGVESKRVLIALEFATVLGLLALTFWSVGPLIEEWGLFRDFNKVGLAFFETFASTNPMRPLHLTAYAMQWFLGGGLPIGVTLGTGVLLVTRYLVARWAVSPFLFGYDRWVVSVLAATLVFWPGVWLGRYGSAQLSAILFFIALGFSIRLYQRWSTPWAAGCAISVALMLAMYQGLTLCLAAIPFVSLLWGRISEGGIANKYSNIINSARICLAVGIGFAIYGVYGVFVSSIVGNSGYEGALAADSARLFTAIGLWTHIKSAYLTAFGKEVYLLPLLLMIAFFLCGRAIERLELFNARLSASALVFLLVGILPMLSLIYINVLHIGDIDRVLFPVSAGFVLVCISLLVRFRLGRSSNLGLFNSLVVVAVLMVLSVVIAQGVRHYVKLQESVMSQTWAAAQRSGATSVMVRDTTGTLGDVYTFLGPTLGDAMAALGRSLPASICTPLSVDRLHYVAQRFPITTTPRCEELPPAPDGMIILTASWLNGELVVVP